MGSGPEQLAVREGQTIEHPASHEDAQKADVH